MWHLACWNRRFSERHGGTTPAAPQDKFERHLISVAHKCQDQDDAVEKALEEVEKAEEE